MKTKIPKEVLDFFYENGTVVDDVYIFLPYWIEIEDRKNGIVKLHSLNEVPQQLKDAVETPQRRSLMDYSHRAMPYHPAHSIEKDNERND